MERIKLNKELLGNHIEFDGEFYEVVNLNTNEKSYSLINQDGSKAMYLKGNEVTEYSNIQEVDESDRWYKDSPELVKGGTYKMRGSSGNEIIKVTSVRKEKYIVDVISTDSNTVFPWSIDKANSILYTPIELPEHKVLPSSRKKKEKDAN